jgi:hypothetical protein
MPSLSTNSTVTLTCTVRNTAGTLVDPDTIELVWKLGRNGDETTVAQASLTNSSTGIWSADVVPEDPADSGVSAGVIKGAPAHLYYEFRMTTPTYVERGKVALSTSEFCS